MDRAGAETMVMNLYREIDRSRFQFDFVYFTDKRCDYDDEIDMLGGRIYHISATNPVTRFWKLYRLLCRSAWKTVHSHTLFSSGLHLSAARMAGVPHRVVHAHSTQDTNSASRVGRLYQRVTRHLIAVSATRYVSCGVAASNYLYPGRQKVVILPNAVDIERFTQASGVAVRNELGIDEKQIVIVQVGRFMPVKNHERSVRIAKALREKGVEFQLLLVGSGPEQDRIKNLIQEEGLVNHIRMLGLRADIPELMVASDVMLMPSLYEGFPVVLVEAQAAGLPSVVSHTVSPEVELGMKMVNFVKLEASDHEWVDTLLTAVSSSKPVKQMRFKMLEKAGFSSAENARRIEKVYSDA